MKKSWYAADYYENGGTETYPYYLTFNENMFGGYQNNTNVTKYIMVDDVPTLQAYQTNFRFLPTGKRQLLRICAASTGHVCHTMCTKDGIIHFTGAVGPFKELLISNEHIFCDRPFSTSQEMPLTANTFKAIYWKSSPSDEERQAYLDNPFDCIALSVWHYWNLVSIEYFEQE